MENEKQKILCIPDILITVLSCQILKEKSLTFEKVSWSSLLVLKEEQIVMHINMNFIYLYFIQVFIFS